MAEQTPEPTPAENPVFNTKYGPLTMNDIMHGFSTMRRELALVMQGGRSTNLDNECGYPIQIDAQMYRNMYDRNGIAARVVNVLPEECWAMRPEIYEVEDETETPFEKQWNEFNTKYGATHYLQRVDCLSGIGHFGIMLIGLNDGKELDAPVAGLSEDGRTPSTEPAKKDLEVMFLRVFDESMVTVQEYEGDITSPRYGQVKFYRVQFFDARNDQAAGIGRDMTVRVVHWHRVIHIADNRLSSEVFGTPRLKNNYNYCLDVKKVLGSSAEMFYKGGFPGYSFETHPQRTEVALDKESIRKEIEEYQSTLKRYFAFDGVHAHSLAPQVASPEDHFRAQLLAIAVSIGVPMRVFIGSEEAKLSSTQDAKTWNKRLAKRQNEYISPLVVRPFIQRLIDFGILIRPKQLVISWPDLNTSTDQERADSAAKKATALATYVGSFSEQACPLYEFLVHFLEFPEKVARLITNAATQSEQMLTEPPMEPASVAA